MEYEESDYGKSTYLKIEKKVEHTWIGKTNLMGKEVPYPTYIPEIKSLEDWHTVVSYSKYIPEDWPLSFHSGYWNRLSEPILSLPNERDELIKIATSRPIIFYEPHEFYRFTMPLPLISHALRGSVVNIKKFWKATLEEKNKDAALSLLPEFERKFIEAQWEQARYHKWQSISEKRQKKIEAIKKPDDNVSVSDVWINKIELSDVWSKVTEGLQEAEKVKFGSYVPPVPPLFSTSDKKVRSQIKNIIRAIAFLRLHKLNKCKANPWFSLYVDQTCFLKTVTGGDEKTGVAEIAEIVNDTFDSRVHVGIALTITGWKNIKEQDTAKRNLKWLIEELSDFGFSKGVPLYLPRGGYYAFEMIDHGAAFFGSLLSGNPFYPRFPGGSDDPDVKFGKLVIYGDGEYTFDKIKHTLQQGKELPKIDGLNSHPTSVQLSDDRIWRTQVSKPRRVGTHIREIKEIVNDIKSRGTRDPALRYLERLAQRYY
jgi:hypothetical protein